MANSRKRVAERIKLQAEIDEASMRSARHNPNSGIGASIALHIWNVLATNTRYSDQGEERLPGNANGYAFLNEARDKENESPNRIKLQPVKAPAVPKQVKIDEIKPPTPVRRHPPSLTK